MTARFQGNINIKYFFKRRRHDYLNSPLAQTRLLLNIYFNVSILLAQLDAYKFERERLLFCLVLFLNVIQHLTDNNRYLN